MTGGYTTVSAANLADAAGNKIANATIYFMPCNNAGIAMSFRVGASGNGQVVDQPVSAQVTGGAFNVELADTTLTLPINAGFLVTCVDNVSGNQLLGPGYIIQPSGASWSFDAFQPNVPALATIQTGPQGQGFRFRGAWAAATSYAAYDVFVESGTSYLVQTAYTSGSSFGSSDTSNAIVFAGSGALTGTLAGALNAPYGATVTEGLTTDTETVTGALTAHSASVSNGASVTGGLAADTLTVGGVVLSLNSSGSFPNAVRAWTDQTGHMALWIDTSGNINISGNLIVNGIATETSDSAAVFQLSGLSISAILNSGVTAAVKAIADPNGRMAFYVDSSGNTWISGTATFAGNATVDGILSAASLSVTMFGVPGLSVSSETPTGALTPVWARADGKGAMASYLDAAGNYWFSGTVNAAAVNAGAITATGPFGALNALVDSETGIYYYVQSTSGYLQVFQQNNGITNQLTFLGNNWALQWSKDGNYLLFMSDRTGTPTQFRMTCGGAEQVAIAFQPDISLQQDICHVQDEGQSLSAGASSGPVVTTTQYGHNQTFSLGPGYDNPSFSLSGTAALGPLIEYEVGTSGETPCSSSCNQFAYLCQRYQGFLPTMSAACSGKGGTDLAGIGPGQTPWSWAVTQISSLVSLFAALTPARKLVPRARFLVHGEQDSLEANTSYGVQLPPYWIAGSSNIGGAAGLMTSPPMFVLQTSSEYNMDNAHTTAIVSPQQLQAVLNTPGALYFVSPEYILQHFYNVSGQPHLLALGYQWMGQLIGRAMYRALALKQLHLGVYPKKIVKNGTTIFIPMYVPPPIGSNAAPSLTFDTTTLPQPTFVAGSMYGFEVYNSAGAVIAITAASIVADANGNNTVVELTLASDPGTGGTVAYAYTCNSSVAGGNPVGAWGNLRDNDACPTLYVLPSGQSLWNWCAHFNMPYSS
jgi:hypothetical protein